MNMNRRQFIAGAVAAASASCLGRGAAPAEEKPTAEDIEKKALIAVTLDLEMCRNFPRWEDTHWDYEKGNLDEAAKRYTLAAARRLEERGGKLHAFVVGRVLEQEKVDWLMELLKDGHSLGNHTYDHVHMKAHRPEDLQYRFQRAPWLIEGKGLKEVIAENIRMTGAAMKARLGITPEGFRTPGGFPNGLEDRKDLQELLLSQGFTWVSSRYPAHPLGSPGEEPSAEVIEGIAIAQLQAQPFVYPSGLVEVPMSPISDIVAFRNGRWKLEPFLMAIRAAVEWAIEHRAAFDFLAHPSCLGVMDPELKAIDLIAGVVEKAGNRAALVDLAAIARRTRARWEKLGR